MTNLAVPVFVAGPDDKLAAIDIYKKLEGTIAGLNLDNLELLESELAKSFKADWANLKDLKILIGNSINGLMVDINALKNGILSATNGIMGYFNSLPVGIQNALLELTGLNKISTTLNGLTKYINNADLSTVTGLAQLIKGISGCEFPLEVQDHNGRLLLSINLVKEASKLGMNESYDAFINCISDRYFGVNLTQAIVPFITETSNYDLLANVANNEYADVVSAYQPSFISEFVSNFTLNPNTTEDEYNNILNSIYDSFGRLNSKWSSDESLNDITQYSNVSSDFRKLLNVNTNSTRINIDDSLNIESNNELSGLLTLVNNSDYDFFKPASSLLDETFNFLA